LKNFHNKRILITGASSGIGWRTALDFAEESARLFLTARRQDRLQKLARLIAESNGTAEIFPCDLADFNARKSLIARILERFGGLDLLVNNAGYGNFRPFLQEKPQDIARMMEVNYTAAAHLMNAFLPGMIEQGFGAVVNVSSGAGKVAIPMMALYSASKFALCALTEAVAYELEGSNVSIHLINPGPVDTEFFRAGVWQGKTPQRTASPAQVSRAIRRAVINNRLISYVPPSRGWMVYFFNLLGSAGRWVMRRKIK
jgi:hypothetical protein